MKKWQKMIAIETFESSALISELLTTVACFTIALTTIEAFNVFFYYEKILVN